MLRQLRHVFNGVRACFVGVRTAWSCVVEVHAPFQSGEDARKEDTRETAQFEHVDHTHAAVAEKALHQGEAKAENHVEKMKSMDRMEFAAADRKRLTSTFVGR